MQKEQIFQLIEKGYEGGKSFNRAVSVFISYLQDDRYFDMANVIANIQKNNLHPTYNDKLIQVKKGPK